MFLGAKKTLKLFQKHCSVRTKRLHKMMFIFFFRKLKKDFNCVLLQRDTSPRDLSIMTLFSYLLLKIQNQLTKNGHNFSKRVP